MNESSWKRYIVRKTIRDNASAVVFGIAWQPEGKDEWIEIKNIRIYVVDSLAKYYKLPDQNYTFDILAHHAAVKEWLDKHAVDYLLIQKDYYSKLRPYFQQYDKIYKIIFDNKNNEELVVRYLHTPL